MTKTEIESLIDHWMERELDEVEDFRATCGRVSDDFRESMNYVLSCQFDDADEALVSCDYRKVAQEADDLLKSAGLPLLDHKSTAFGRLCRRLLIAKQEITRIEADRWEGIYKDIPRGNGNGSTLPNKGQSVSLHEHRRPIAEVIRLYFQENQRAERTDGQIKAELERFLQLIEGGERPIGTISKADTRAYKEDMLQVRNLGLATCIKHLSNLSVLFKWAEAQGFIAENSNPVRGLAPNKRQAKKQSAQRRPFTDEELLKVFGSVEFRKQRETAPERYWLTLICLFEICRREEAGQLAVADIGEQDAIPFIRITDEGEGKA